MSLLKNHNWTPIVESIAKERGLVSAAVFGIVWRHCQKSDGVCYASMETMADSLGTDRATILRHIKKLCEDGYLEDLTPNRRNAPHTYADTGKAAIQSDSNTDEEEAATQLAKNHHSNLRRAEFQQNKGQLTLALIERDGYKCAECGVYENLTIDHIIPISKGGSDNLDNLRFLCRSHNSKKGDNLTVAHSNTFTEDNTVVICNTPKMPEVESIAQSNSSSQSVAHSNATVAECNATVAESHLKIDSKETLLRESKRERVAPASKKEAQLQKLKRIGSVDYLSQNEPIAVKLSEICGNSHPRYVSNGKRKELAESVAQLVEWGVTTEQIQAFKDSYWWADDPPRYRQVVDEWGRYLTSKESPKQYKNGGSTNGTYSNGPKRNTDPDRIPSVNPFAGDPALP